MCLGVVVCTSLPFILLTHTNGWKSALSLDFSHMQTRYTGSDTTMRAPTHDEQVVLTAAFPSIKVVAMVVQHSGAQPQTR